MQVKTITTAAGVNEIDFGNDNSQSTAHFYWLKNLGDSTLYVSANPNPIAEKDDVAELPAKGAVSVETDEGKIYILGAGKVEIHRTNSKFCPFDWQSSGSGGGGGGSITVDSELSDTSTNPLQNKVTTAAINEVKSDLAKTQEDVAENAAALNTKSDIDHTHDITANGNPVTLDGLQGSVPFSEITVSGKNLLKYPYVQTTQTSYGVTFTDNGDGSITASGTHDGGANLSFFGFSPWWASPNGGRLFLPKGNTVTFRVMGLPNTYQCQLVVKKDNTSTDTITVVYRIGESVANYTAEQDCYIACGIYGLKSSAGQAVNFTAYPQLESGDTATTYEPPITGRELTVNVSGKNLLQKMTDKTNGGLHYSPNDDGSVSVTGTQTAENYPNITSVSGMLLKSGEYALSGGTERLQITALDIDTNTVIARAKIAPATFSIDTDKYIRIYVYSSGAYNSQTFDDVIYPQLEIGSTATPYEPYHGTEYNITPNNNPYTIPNDICQLDGLNNISVSAGELSVVGVQKNAAIKRIWDDMGMDLLFDGVTSADNPAVVDLANYKFVEIHHIMAANEKTYPSNIRLSLDSYLSSASTIITVIHNSSISTIHTEEGTVSSVYAISAAGSNMNNTKIYGIK